MICRHCRKCHVVRPRGLCWVCYYNPAVRDLYPAYTTGDGADMCSGANAMTEAEILAMPPQPNGDDDPQPEPHPPEPEPPALGDWRHHWGTPPEAWQLTPDTEPEAIAAAQRGDVAEALAALGPGATAEQISDYTVLPVWTVRRRLGELSSREG